MASHSGLKAPHEAIGAERFGTDPTWSTVMHDIGLWLGAIGLVCLALESFDVAIGFFAIGVWMLAS
jgi:hypothetical protein